MNKLIVKEKTELFKFLRNNLTNMSKNNIKTLLKNGNMTVENISYAIGYPNAEHFIRLFKKTFSMTPIQYRNMK